MIKNICKKPFALLLVLLCVIVVLTIEPKKKEQHIMCEKQGQAYHAGNYATREYVYNGSNDSANQVLNADYGRLHGNFKYCSPESCPHGDSEPEVSLMAPARGPFPYYLK
jgi:hypothetical protein